MVFIASGVGFGAAMWGSEPLIWGSEVSFANNGVRRSEMWGSPSLPPYAGTICRDGMPARHYGNLKILKIVEIVLIKFLMIFRYQDTEPYPYTYNTQFRTLDRKITRF